MTEGRRVRRRLFKDSSLFFFFFFFFFFSPSVHFQNDAFLSASSFAGSFDRVDLSRPRRNNVGGFTDGAAGSHAGFDVSQVNGRRSTVTSRDVMLLQTEIKSSKAKRHSFVCVKPS